MAVTMKHPQDVHELASKLVNRFGPEAETRIERWIARARSVGQWEQVTFWCRVRWRARLLLAKGERIACLP